MSRGWPGGSDTRWRNFRAWFLQLELPEAQRPPCAIEGPKCTVVATQVDHIELLANGGAKYDPGNCRPACEPCNTGRRVQVLPEPPPVRVSSW